MAQTATLASKPRTGRGSGKARQLRRQGVIPGVVYGHKQEAVSIAVENEEMWGIIRRGVRVVDLELGGATEKCLVKEVQWDALGREIVHVDFTRVSADERIRIMVPVVLRGTAPGINAGGVLDQPLHTLDIECLAIEVPDHIRVNIGELQIGQAVHLKDVQLPPGVKVFGDPEAIVVHVTKPVEEAAAPAEAAAGPAEPEVIGRKAAEEKAEEAE